jgi:hypothetical protein
MHKSQRTSIDDLDAIGNELAEEHLRLAVGGDLKKTITFDGTGCSNNVCWDEKFRKV